MEKILVEVVLPSASTSYDVYIPLSSPVSEVLFLVSNLLGELSSGYFKADNATVLCDAETGNVLNINTTVFESGLKNGSKLLLI